MTKLQIELLFSQITYNSDLDHWKYPFLGQLTQLADWIKRCIFAITKVQGTTSWMKTKGRTLYLSISTQQSESLVKHAIVSHL